MDNCNPLLSLLVYLVGKREVYEEEVRQTYLVANMC